MLLLKARLALELPPINKALSRAAEGLPHPVRPIARHIFEAGGKRLRPLLTILMARLLGYDKKDIYDLAVTMEMLHAATLLHDDVLDNADTRRGKPAAHTIFNATSTILAGDAMLAHANALVAQCGDPRLVPLLLRGHQPHRRRRDPGDRGPASGGDHRPRNTRRSSAARRPG